MSTEQLLLIRAQSHKQPSRTKSAPQGDETSNSFSAFSQLLRRINRPADRPTNLLIVTLAAGNVIKIPFSDEPCYPLCHESATPLGASRRACKKHGRDRETTRGTLTKWKRNGKHGWVVAASSSGF